MPTTLIPHEEIKKRIDLLEKLLNDTYRPKDKHRFCCSVMPEKLDDPYQFANISITIILYRGERGKEPYSDTLENMDLRIGDHINSAEDLMQRADEKIHKSKATPYIKLRDAILAGITDVVEYTQKYVTEKGLYFGQDLNLLRWARQD